MRRRFLFNALSDTGWLVLLVLAVLAAGVCIWLLYRYERKLVDRKLGLILLTLRLLTVGVVFLTLLEPVITWTIDRERTGRVLLAVDVSDSMASPDRHADQAERLRWLRATGMIGNDAVDARLDRYLEAFQNDQEPEWVDREEAVSDAERDALAASRKQQMDELLASAGELPRKEIARRLITGGPRPLEKALNDLAIVERQVFAGQATRVDATSFAERISQPGDALRTESSDLFKGATPVSGESTQTPLAGVVLFTDGRDTADPEGRRLLQQMASLGVPIYPVPLGSSERPRDLAIGQLEFPRTLYQEDAGIISAEIRATGFEGEEVTVTLEHVDHPDDVQTTTVTPTDRTAEVRFEIKPADVGRQQYVLRVQGGQNETRDDNNEKSFAMKVLDKVTDESRVLVLEGEARWEFRFLNAALARDEHIALDTVLFRQPYLGLLPGTFFPRELPLPGEAEATAARESIFSKYDLVIVGDVPEPQLPAVAWSQLDKFVREEGGTLVLTAGKNHFPQTYRSPVVAELLPVTDLQVVESPAAELSGPPHTRGFHLEITPEGSREEMLQFAADPLKNDAVWSQLPGHTWGMKGHAKPAATVFAARRHPPGNEGLDFERANALIAHQHVGAGQTVWVGLESTWRWRHREGATHHERFWGQMSRWAARFKASAGNEFVRFGLDRSEIDAGDDVIVRARWEERFLGQHPDLVARAELRPLTDTFGPPLMTVNLVAVDTQPTVHEGTASGLPPGEFEVRLVVDNAALGDEPVVTELSVAEKLTTELAELSVNRNLLDQIAEVTGGRVFLPDEVHEIPAVFEDVRESEHSREEIALWDHWLVLVACCGLLCTEWVLRKLNGLP